MKTILVSIAISFASLMAFGQPFSSDTVLHIAGDGAKSIALKLDDLTALPHRLVHAVDHDKQDHVFEGVELYRVATLAGIRFSDTLRGRGFTSSVLVVQAADGYQAVFTLAEIDPTNSSNSLILAYREDGKWLDAKNGPLRIISPSEKRHVRWVRQVQSMHVVHVG
ncbi:MAG TPA: molybdopterin-dependent oxidoreductase [Bacteroidota bacterium]|nr:molybdopterin-dependent oxidoreductase [Bacteroidota bacterium]